MTAIQPFAEYHARNPLPVQNRLHHLPIPMDAISRPIIGGRIHLIGGKEYDAPDEPEEKEPSIYGKSRDVVAAFIEQARRPMTIGDIAEATALHHTTVNRHVKHFAGKGLVMRQFVLHDGFRRIMVSKIL